MPPPIKHVLFSGLDPVPIRTTVAEEVSFDAMWLAAHIPPSSFVQTVQPFQLHQHAVDHYELVLGPAGFGAELLEALRWLARVAAAGIVSTLPRDDVIAFVQHYLEVDKPEWGYEELTDHAGTFITERYQRVTIDADYRQGLDAKRHDPVLPILSAEIRQWIATR